MKYMAVIVWKYGGIDVYGPFDEKKEANVYMSNMLNQMQAHRITHLKAEVINPWHPTKGNM